MNKGKIKPKEKKSKKEYSKKEIIGMIDRGEFDHLIVRDIEKDTGLTLHED